MRREVLLLQKSLDALNENNYRIKKIIIEVKNYSDCSDVIANVEHEYFHHARLNRYEVIEEVTQEEAERKAVWLVEILDKLGYIVEKEIQKN